MAYALPGFQGVASGNITPNRVVAITTSADNKISQSVVATSPNIGIAQSGTRRAPGTGDDDGFAAIAGETCMFWGVGSIGLGEAASAITPGDFVTADSAGRLVTTTTAGDTYVGFAMQAAAAVGDMIEVMVFPGRYR